MPTLPPLDLAAAAASLRAGGLVGHSTSSLCGIAADPYADSALDALDALKQRRAGGGYVHVVDVASRAADWVLELPLAERLWRVAEVPLTLILPAGPAAAARSTGPGATLALRRDPHPHVAALCGEVDRPLVSTSLNLPGAPPAALLDTLPAALAAALAGRLTLDDERDRTPALGQPSTLLRRAGDGWQVVRRGALDDAALTRLLGATQ